MAQLGARFNGIEEVTGSNPVRSTIPPFLAYSYQDERLLNFTVRLIRIETGNANAAPLMLATMMLVTRRRGVVSQQGSGDLVFILIKYREKP